MTIRVCGASFSYGTSGPVFNDLDFHLDSGRIMSVLGPNGCGKTTLLKCLVGIRSFSSGVLVLDGREGLATGERSRLFGFVPQLVGDPVPYSVERMVILGRARFMGPMSRPGHEDIEMARESMLAVGIDGLSPRAFNSLSGGERQLVLIAQALATGAKTLVFDEPTSALDLVNQHDTVELLRRLSHEQGYTIIFSSHDPSHALHISDACLMMDRSGGYRFGPSGSIITEEGIKSVFGVDSKIIRHETHGRGFSLGVLPVLKPFNRVMRTVR